MKFLLTLPGRFVISPFIDTCGTAEYCDVMSWAQDFGQDGHFHPQDFPEGASL